LLMTAHSVIPHHHHTNNKEAAQHHEHEHTSHQHEHEKSDGHDHTAHFVHSPEFGNYIGASSIELNDISQFYVALAFVAHTTFNFSFESFVSEANWYPDLPPPNDVFNPLSHSLRGPPHFIS
jgi:hypothetical protein